MRDLFEVDIAHGCPLRQLQPADAEALYQLTLSNRDRLREWLPWLGDGYSRADTDAFVRRSTAEFEQDGLLQAGIWVDGSIAGCVGLRDFRRADRSAAVGYWLGTSFEGRGLMTRAVCALTDYVFRVLQLNRLEIRCAVGNLRSRAIPERLGFTCEGTLREADQLYGRFVDMVVYSMLAREYVTSAGRDPGQVPPGDNSITVADSSAGRGKRGLRQRQNQSAPQDLYTRQVRRRSRATEPCCNAPRTWDKPDHFLLALADPWYGALVKVQDTISVSTMQFFRGRGLTTLHLPVTTYSISSPMGLGSDSQPVKVDLLGVETYMADSMQFMLEYGLRILPKGCYYLMPSFRGENADDRHLCQFYHAEAEIRGSLTDVMQLVEEYLLSMTRDMLSTCGAEIERIAGSLAHVEGLLAIRDGFPRLTFREAVQVLDADPRFIAAYPSGCRYLTRDGEAELLKRTSTIMWVTHFDHLSVPFYQAFGDDPTTARAADLLLGMGETVGAGERHITEDLVRQALALHHVDPKPYDWYCRMKQLYPMQTAGFGLGVERYVCWLFQHDDIRDCQLLPRFNGLRNTP